MWAAERMLESVPVGAPGRSVAVLVALLYDIGKVRGLVVAEDRPREDHPLQPHPLTRQLMLLALGHFSEVAPSSVTALEELLWADAHHLDDMKRKRRSLIHEAVLQSWRQ